MLAAIGEPHLGDRLMVQIAEYCPTERVHTAQVYPAIPQHGHMAGGMDTTCKVVVLCRACEAGEVQVLEHVGRATG